MCRAAPQSSFHPFTKFQVKGCEFRRAGCGELLSGPAAARRVPGASEVHQQESQLPIKSPIRRLMDGVIGYAGKLYVSLLVLCLYECREMVALSSWSSSHPLGWH